MFHGLYKCHHFQEQSCNLFVGPMLEINIEPMEEMCFIITAANGRPPPQGPVNGLDISGSLFIFATMIVESTEFILLYIFCLFVFTTSQLV